MKDKEARKAIIKIATDLGYYQPEDLGDSIYLSDHPSKLGSNSDDLWKSDIISALRKIEKIYEYLGVEESDKLVKRKPSSDSK